MKKGFLGAFALLLGLSLIFVGVDSFGATAKKAAPVQKSDSAKEPQYGGTVTFSRALNPIAWDKAEWAWKHANDTGFFMEHLLAGDLQKGPRGTNQFSFHNTSWIPPEVTRGELLESWEVKKTPMQIILRLRKGIMWQEKPGIMKARELTAEDIVYNINRQKNARKAIPLYLDFVGKMETPDKYTVVINMTEWCVDWFYRIGWGYYDAIQAPEQEKAPGGPNKWENSTGTGPFMITEYKDGHSQIYTKNPNYWDSEIINGKKYKLPFVDKIHITLIRDEQTRIAAFRSGKLDLLMALNWKYVDELKKSLPQLKWGRILATGNFSMALRMDRKPFNDIRVRRAMNLAVNKKEIIDTFYGGNAELHTYPFPPSFKEVYTPLEKLSPAAQELYKYDPAKAKQLLAEAGYPNGFSIKAQIANNSDTGMDLAAMVVSYLGKIGVKVDLEPMDFIPHMGRMIRKTHSEGFFFSNDHGSPYSGIRKNFMTGQTWNPHMMSDAYLDKACTEAMENPKLTEKQRLEIIKKLAVYALEQAPCIVLPTAYGNSAWWPWVQNFYGEFFAGAQNSGPIYARVWIDQEMKKKMGY
ncbi:MAG: ABC transporter substrate-binding protein [Thermodesulfobacteriota bacterium]